jgi:2-polyprenyl-6-methoxyphenol hydroxylase-like FAD-dependent oxidoreductase
MPEQPPFVIVGAGPVGLLLANLLGRAGVPVEVRERRQSLPERSMAIGITPPSMELLRGLGLLDAFVSQGVVIRRARVSEAGAMVGQVDFHALGTSILSIPQRDTVRLLRESLHRFPSVKIREGVEVTSLADNAPSLLWVACDGHRGGLRELAGIGLREHPYRSRFAMADYPDQESFGSDARLWFSAQGSLESFPLPGQQRRWVAQILGTPSEAEDYLRESVLRRSGIDLSGRTAGPCTVFQPRWRMARTFHRGKVALCGDSAHLMSPIGGQGMNTGWGDAALLALLLPVMLHHPEQRDALMRQYTRERQRTFRHSSRRMGAGMWMGTRQGAMASSLRGFALRRTLAHPGLRASVARTFAMLNLPRAART